MSSRLETTGNSWVKRPTIEESSSSLRNPKGFDPNVYDATDATIPDPISRVDLNPNHDWRFRSKTSVNPMHSGRLLGRIMIGKVPPRITIEGVDDILRQVPLPIKNSTLVQNCVTWVLAAVEVMQKQDLAEAFDVDQFSIKALELADQWLKDPNPRHFHNYTNRPR
ncbi:hypothetical protein Z517_09653 [Fonsecaea pedrosoi CBS 271.37]|uniref:Uncharacterized protein n=1 Tax=Fonsecaea pedrosoi CBS 271.37 TaxID=1442368 RepID=A0A0D2ESI7_9EURO|nr:uncharacterized protein Z517_09653 [Fonsecaea pedrosoi CBS 271.37]KIW77207.1 hypothetical protein Z517_09653 [Fonsecaea pedrosoi CBS 271.37]